MIRIFCENALWQTKPTVTTVVPTLVSLASHAFKWFVAVTHTCITIAYPTIATLHPRMSFVIMNHLFVTPCRPVGTSSTGAVGTHVVYIPVKTSIALAPITALITFPVARARVFAYSDSSVSSLIKLSLYIF